MFIARQALPGWFSRGQPWEASCSVSRGEQTVRYLRLLSNSMAAALLGAGYVFAVVLQLNPTLSLDPARLAPLALTVVLFYATHLTAFFYACPLVRDLLARKPFSPAWFSVTAVSRLAAVSAAGGALLMWLNLRTFDLVLPSGT